MATHAITDLAIILKPEDDVAIAKRRDHGGHRPRGRREHASRSGRTSGPGTRSRDTRGGAVTRCAGTGRSSASPRRTSPWATMSTRRISRSASSSATYEVGTDVTPVDYLPAGAHALLRRVQARGRPGRHAQLRGDHLGRELLRQREPVRQGQVPRRAAASTRTSTACSRSPTSRAAAPSSSARTTWRSSACSRATRKHPNVAAYILIGLGCEVNQAAVMVDKQRHGGARTSRAQARHRQHPGGGRHPEDGGASGGRSGQAAARSPTRRAARRSPSRSWCSPPTAAARTATPGSPPTRRSAGRSTSSCDTAGPASWRRLPRSTARSTS